MASADGYAVLPIGLWIRNEFGGPECYDVSSLEDDPRGWREGLGVGYGDADDDPPADDRFIAEAEAAIRDCTALAVQHFSSIGVVILPRDRDGRHNMALVVPASDGERARDLAWFRSKMPPSGRLRHLFVDADSDWASRSQGLDKLIDLFDAASAAALQQDFGTPPYLTAALPTQGEDMLRWASRVCLSSERVDELSAGWKESGENIRLFGFHSVMAPSVDIEPDWLVPGMYRRNVVSSFVGPGGVGKSTALVELAVKTGQADSDATFLGEQIIRKSGSCVYITGEDGRDDIEQMKAAFGAAKKGHVIPASEGGSIDECLALVEHLDQIDLIIVDSATRFVKEENEASDSGPFYDCLSDAAQRYNAVVIVIHHITKNFRGGIASIRPAIRGSGVHVDRPRMVVGMVNRQDGSVDIGIVKRNVPLGAYEWGPVGVGRRFDRTLDGLVEVAAKSGPIPTQDNAALLDWIIAQVTGHNAARKKVFRTGAKGIYALCPTCPVPFSRARIDAGVAELMAANRLISSPDHGLSIPVSGAA